MAELVECDMCRKVYRLKRLDGASIWRAGFRDIGAYQLCHECNARVMAWLESQIPKPDSSES